MNEMRQVYIAYRIDVNEDLFPEEKSLPQSIHKTYLGAKAEVNRLIAYYVHTYPHLNGVEEKNVECVIGESCYVRTMELKE